MNTQSRANSILRHPLAWIVLTLVVIFGIFTGFFVVTRFITGNWPQRSESTLPKEKW